MVTGPFKLSQMARFHSFLWLSSTSLYMCVYIHTHTYIYAHMYTHTHTHIYAHIQASFVAHLVKNPHAMWETGFNPWVGKIPWRRKRLPTPVFWLGKFHGLYRPWDCKESDTTE